MWRRNPDDEPLPCQTVWLMGLDAELGFQAFLQSALRGHLPGSGHYSSLEPGMETFRWHDAEILRSCLHGLSPLQAFTSDFRKSCVSEPSRPGPERLVPMSFT